MKVLRWIKPGIKRLVPLAQRVPHRRLPLNLNIFRLLRLLRFLSRCLISSSDEALLLSTEDGLYIGNVECLED